MNKLPLYFGYAGALPFVLFMLLSFGMDEARHFQALSFIQLSYGAMILSFLGGVHWGQAIPSNNAKQMGFAMVPTIACLALMVWTLVADPAMPLFAMAGLFWIVFLADKRLMPLGFIPEGYFTFRRNLTMIVSGTLIVSGLVSL
ncbi:MAG: DUF3429 domain-containing protein [Alphaproteobacteria bacterium]|nr:DUF3429 domain-containing protein [Alphaproteobacteria bacterium]